MRVSKEKAAENREALLTAAGRLFRERGIDGVGVADIGKAAGLTHGALYAHFDSKEALAAAAFSKGFERSLALMKARGGGGEPSLSAYLAFLLSAAMRDSLATGCPLAASTSEVARQGDAVSASFTEGFQRMAAVLEPTLDPRLPAAERGKQARALIAAQIGAIAVARAVARTDMTLSDEVLESVRALLERGAPVARPRRARKG